MEWGWPRGQEAWVLGQLCLLPQSQAAGPAPWWHPATDPAPLLSPEMLRLTPGPFGAARAAAVRSSFPCHQPLRWLTIHPFLKKN